MTAGDSIKNFFGLKKIPFSKGLGVNELFLGASFKEAISRLNLALENEDITLITGPIGSGKSNTLRSFSYNLDPHSYSVAYVPAGNLKIGEIVKRALGELNMTIPFHGVAALRSFKQTVIQLNRNKGIKPVLLIDEAQELPLNSLLALKNLLNYNMDSDNLILIILCGQTSLNEMLHLTPLESLNRRIRIRYSLKPLSLEETSLYISHSLKVCGLDKNIFTDDARAKIFHLSKGIISKINKYCFELIVYAVSTSKDLIEPSMLDAIICEE